MKLNAIFQGKHLVCGDCTTIGAGQRSAVKRPGVVILPERSELRY